jgi:hypothetical protein
MSVPWEILGAYVYIRWSVDISELLRASDGTLSRWSRLHLELLAPTNPHGARVVVARSPYVKSIRKACAPAVNTLIG